MVSSSPNWEAVRASARKYCWTAPVSPEVRTVHPLMMTSPSVEALQEFKGTTATPVAGFGRTTGRTESFVTKGGTNQYHGTAFDIFINDALNSNGWFEHGLRNQCDPTDTACLNKYRTAVNRKNDYGGSFGGPLRIPHLYNGTDRTFFFFSWGQFRRSL